MKIKKNMQEHIDSLNKELRNFANYNPQVIFNEVRNTEENYTEGSLTFRDFTVLFRCCDGATGYSFSETNILDVIEYKTIGTTIATYEMFFKFDFSPIRFSVYDIHNVLNDQNFRTLCFHNIFDENSASEAAKTMLDFIQKNEVAISRISNDITLQKQLYDNYIYDEKVFNKDFNEEAFLKDINESMMIHELFMSLHGPIQEGLERFILTGNNKQLVKNFNKAEKKNNLILFEKRYEKYLYDNNFPKVEGTVLNKTKNVKRKNKATSIANVVCLFLSFTIGVLITHIVTTVAVDFFHPNSLVLATTAEELEILLIVLSQAIIYITLTYKLPVIKDKVNRIFKEKYDIPVIIIGLILFVTGICISVNNYKNHAILIKNDTLYVDNSSLNATENVEFIFIKGYEYEENDGVVFSDSVEDRFLYYVINKDYECFCNCNLFTDDGNVTDEVLNKLKEAGCTVTSYRTINDYATAHGFEIE